MGKPGTKFSFSDLNRIRGLISTEEMLWSTEKAYGSGNDHKNTAYSPHRSN